LSIACSVTLIMPGCVLFCHGPANCAFRTLSLHDALPISVGEAQLVLRRVHREVGIAAAADGPLRGAGPARPPAAAAMPTSRCTRDRKSTRLNSSHEWISYAVFCLKKKRKP